MLWIAFLTAINGQFYLSIGLDVLGQPPSPFDTLVLQVGLGSYNKERLRTMYTVEFLEVVVTHKGNKYIVNNRNQIISVKTGDMMQWGEENGDRKEILRLSQIAFKEKQKAESAAINSNGTELGGNTIINQEENRLNLNNSNKEINYGQEFRRVQEESRKGGAVSGRAESLTVSDRQRLADLLRRELESQGINRRSLLGSFVNDKHGSSFSIYGNVNPQLFHDIFEVVRYYTPNGE